MLNGLGNNIKLTSLLQEEATVENIKEALFEGVDIWHFAGHGVFDERNPMDSSLIVWGDGDKQYDRLSIRLLSTLAMNQNLGFCFLNACDTARSTEFEKEKENWGKSDNFVNMAHSLIQAGVPMVLATNHIISNKTVIRFTKKLFQ